MKRQVEIAFRIVLIAAFLLNAVVPSLDVLAAQQRGPAVAEQPGAVGERTLPMQAPVDFQPLAGSKTTTPTASAPPETSGTPTATLLASETATPESTATASATGTVIPTLEATLTPTPEASFTPTPTTTGTATVTEPPTSTPATDDVPESKDPAEIALKASPEFITAGGQAAIHWAVGHKKLNDYELVFTLSPGVEVKNEKDGVYDAKGRCCMNDKTW